MLKANVYSVAAFVSAVLLTSSGANAAETRCGWYMNPTPGNLLLVDKDKSWWITSQMQAQGPDALGADDNAPNFDSKEYVTTQPNGYGYGCACLNVETDAKAERITKVISGKTVPIAQCKADKSLGKPHM